MNDAKQLTVHREDAVVWVTLTRPDRLNALNSALVNELADLLASLRTDLSARVIVLRGSGRAFCAGLDVVEFEGSGMSRLAEIVTALHTGPQVVIALVHGAATGGGLAMALAADVRIAGDTAFFSAGFSNLGLTGCELGTSYFLPRAIGTSATAELLLTRRRLAASRALQLGLVSDVVPDADLEAAGRSMAQDMLQLSPKGLRLGKETLRRTAGISDLGQVIAIESDVQQECSQGPNFTEAIAAFREKRTPVFVDNS